MNHYKILLTADFDYRVDELQQMALEFGHNEGSAYHWVRKYMHTRENLDPDTPLSFVSELFFYREIWSEDE